MNRHQVYGSSCAALALLLGSSALAQSVTHNGVVYAPATSSTSVQLTTFAGEPYIVASATGTSLTPHVIATPLTSAIGYECGVIPWMLPTAPPVGANTQFHLDAATPGGAVVPSVIEITLASTSSGHGIHFGSSISPDVFSRARIEYRLAGQPVMSYFINPCNTFGGIISESICDFIVSTYCYATLAPECHCFFYPEECPEYEVGGTIVGRTITGYARLGAPHVVTTAGRPPFTIDEIVFVGDLNSAAPTSTFASARLRGGGGMRSIALRDMALIRRCPADFNGDSAVTSQDYFDFIRAFFGGDLSADVNGDNAVTSQDYFDFIRAFFGGC